MSMRQYAPFFRLNRFRNVSRGGAVMPWYNLYRKHHEANCGRSNIRCFKCNEMGHYTRECTKVMIREPSVQGSNAPRTRRVGRPLIAIRTIGARSEACRAP